MSELVGVEWHKQGRRVCGVKEYTIERETLVSIKFGETALIWYW